MTSYAAGWLASGMTTRDYFAAQALGGLLSDIRNIDSLTGESRSTDGAGQRAYIVKAAYVFADAMLAERDKAKP